MKIGLRMTSEGYKMPFAQFCEWCTANGFEAVDFAQVTPEVAQTAAAAGLLIGQVDLPGTRELLSADIEKQAAGAEAAKAAIRAAAQCGVKVMF